MDDIASRQLAELADLLESENVCSSLGGLETQLQQCQVRLEATSKEYATDWYSNICWKLDQLNTLCKDYLREAVNDDQFRLTALKLSRSLRLAVKQPDEFMELKGQDLSDHLRWIMGKLAHRQREWPKPVTLHYQTERPTGRIRRSVNERMLLALQKDPIRSTWTADQWAADLSCSPGTVKGTATWKNIMAMRASNISARRTRSR